MSPTPGEDARLHADLRTWRDVVRQSVADLWEGSVLEWAASIAFYAVLSLFPLIIALLIVASYVTDGDWAARQAVALLGQYLPTGEGDIREILDAALAERRNVGIISLILFLLTGRRVLGVLTKGLNHVSDVDEHRDPYTRRIAVELAMLAGLVGLGLLALGAQPLIRWLWEAARMLPGPDTLGMRASQGFVRVLVLLGVFACVYYYVPRGQRLWRAALAGAAMATALFLIAEGVFTLLLDRIWQTMGLIYGPLALAALLLSWSWYVALVTLVGGGVASHVKALLIEDRDVAQVRKDHTGR